MTTDRRSGSTSGPLKKDQRGCSRSDALRDSGVNLGSTDGDRPESAALNYHFSVGEQRFVFDGRRLGVYRFASNALPCPDELPNRSRFDSSRGTFLRSLALNLTNNCNLRCSYCFANQGNYDNPGAEMSLETACRSIDLLLESVTRNNGDLMTIGFFGGEPLLAFNLIREIVTYVGVRLPRGIRARYLLTTNGTLVTAEHVRFFAEHRFKVMLSIDGTPENHNASRLFPGGGGSYVEAAKAAELLLGSVSTEARITIADGNTAVDRSISHLLSLGFRRLTYALDSGLSEEGFSEFMAALERLFIGYRRSIGLGRYYDISNVTEPLSSIVLKKKKRSHCNAGVSYMSVSAEGKLYRCPRFTGIRRFSSGAVDRIGEFAVAAEVDRFRLALSEGAQSRTPECGDCPFVYVCGGMCFHHTISLGKGEFGIVQRECAYRRRLFGLVLEMLCGLTATERRSFLLYLTNVWKNGKEVR